ncbi:MAG: hypothetical protein ACO3A2_05740 [Bdellovibrionia bacterium]
MKPRKHMISFVLFFASASSVGWASELHEENHEAVNKTEEPQSATPPSAASSVEGSLKSVPSEAQVSQEASASPGQQKASEEDVVTSILKKTPPPQASDSAAAQASSAQVRPALDSKAYDPKHPQYFALALGADQLTSSGSSAQLVYSLRAGQAVGENRLGLWSVGAYFGSYPLTHAVSDVSAQGNTLLLALDLLVRRTFGSGLYWGVRLGAGFSNLTLRALSPEVSATGSIARLALGPVLGYEAPLSKRLNFLVDVSWMTLKEGTMAFPILDARYNSVQVAAQANFQVQLGVSYNWGGVMEESAPRALSSAESNDQRLKRILKEHHIGQRWSLTEGWVDDASKGLK